MLTFDQFKIIITKRVMFMKIYPERLHFIQLEPKKFFYGTFLTGIATTVIMFVLILTSDFLAEHAQIHILLVLAGLILTICAIWTGITVIFKSGMGKKAIDIIILFFSSLHALFASLILILLIL